MFEVNQDLLGLAGTLTSCSEPEAVQLIRDIAPEIAAGNSRAMYDYERSGLILAVRGALCDLVYSPLTRNTPTMQKSIELEKAMLHLGIESLPTLDS